MQITHDEARKLIQFNADEALNLQKKAALYAHLKDCIECRVYAEDIKEVESILLPVMKRRWNLQPVPLSIDALTSERYSKIQTSILLATRTAIISVVFVAFIFSVWQFTRSGTQTSSQFPVGVLPVPTPSTQSTSAAVLWTSTKVTQQNCEEIPYTVQENDTLESIAYQFAISKEEIMVINNMKTETVIRAMELIIPKCNSTPTGTAEGPATLTTTYTPSIDLTTFTPDG